MPAQRRRTNHIAILGALIEYRQTHNGKSPSFREIARMADVVESVAYRSINTLNEQTPPLVKKIAIGDRRRRFVYQETDAGLRKWKQQERPAAAGRKEES